MATRVDAALASDTEGPHNGILVSPEEMLALGQTEDEAARQLVEWEKLTPADVAFQQCLRARLGYDLDIDDNALLSGVSSAAWDVRGDLAGRERPPSPWE